MLPLTPSLFIPLFYLTPFQNRTLEAAAAPMLFYWGLWGTGGKGLSVQVFLKDKQNQGDQPQVDLGTVLGRGCVEPSTELSGPSEQRTRISQEEPGDSRSYFLCRDQNTQFEQHGKAPSPLFDSR